MLGNAGTIYLPLDGVIDVDAELQKLEKQKGDLQKWIGASQAKLKNEKFLSKAPQKVVDDAKAHLDEMLEKLSRVEEVINTLK
jgi:valyl-tRNA synthetase